MWLGVTLSLNTKYGWPGATMAIPASKGEDFGKEIDELLNSAGMAQKKKKIRHVAGRVGWIAGFAPWARAFASLPIAAPHRKPGKWSERTAKPRSKRPGLGLTVKPARLLQGDLRSAAGECKPHGLAFTIQCDASPWSFSGLSAHNDQVVSLEADKVTDAKRRLISGEAGDPLSGRVGTR